MRRMLLAAVALSLGASQLVAQQAEDQRDGGERLRLGGGLAVIQPHGTFAETADLSVGISGHLLYDLDGAGVLALRLDGGVVGYGSDRRLAPLSSSIGGRILVEVTTTNNLAILGGGPQLSLPLGPVRPYLHGFAGLAFLSTDSSLRSASQHRRDERLAMTRHHSDLTTALGGGAGLRVPVGRIGPGASLNLGVQALRTGEVEYLGPDDIRDMPDGSLLITPQRSEIETLTYTVGLSLRPPTTRRARR